MSLKQRFIFIAALTTLLVAATTLLSGNYLRGFIEEQARDTALSSVEALWRETLRGQWMAMKSSFPSFTRNRALIEGLERRRGRLVREGAITIFRRLSTAGVFSRLEVIDTRGVVRFSEPPDERPLLRGGLVVQALHEQRVIEGIERNWDGRLELTYAFPLYKGTGRAVGAVLFARVA